MAGLLIALAALLPTSEGELSVLMQNPGQRRTTIGTAVLYRVVPAALGISSTDRSSHSRYIWPSRFTDHTFSPAADLCGKRPQSPTTDSLDCRGTPTPVSAIYDTKEDFMGLQKTSAGIERG